MALEISQNVWWQGADEAPTSPEWLTAGPLAAGLEDGQLRGILLNGREIVRRIYAAVRDQYWNTVPGVIRDLQGAQEGGGFRVTFTSEHVSAEVDFVWHAEITGTAEGTLTYVFDGEARKEMRKNRVGLCLLLPLSLKGTPGVAEYVSGDRATVTFPDRVDPMQPVKGLHDFRELRYSPAAGVEVRLDFEGDVFEIEDQRNWTDASYKIYSTPQRIPMPARMTAGQRVRQVITLSLSTAAPLPAAVVPVIPEIVTVTVGEGLFEIPALGTTAAYHGGALTETQTARLRALRLAHYRVEVDTATSGWQQGLEQGLRDAAAIGAKAEVMFTVSDDVEAEAEAAAAVTAGFPDRVAGWLILTRGAPATRAASLETARKILGGQGAPVGGGTNADFFQLNNNRPPQGLTDFVSVPLRPCAHQFDRATMIENLEGQREVLKTLAALYPDIPLSVSPVSIRTRAQKGPAAGPGEMPAQADARQMSLLGAGWTLGCIKAVAESGVKSLTLFQTTGLRGLMERETGSDAPRDFLSVPDSVFPLYFVLAALSGWSQGSVTEATSSAPHTADALIVTKEGRVRVLLANYSPNPVSVFVGHGGEPLFGAGRVATLHAGNVAAAVSSPDSWLAAPPVGEARDGLVSLPPFAIAWVDVL